MQAPQVSIIIAMYKSAPYLEATVASVLAQTFSDWELLLVDDKSPDSTLEVASALAKKDKRIAVKALPKNNGGPSVARNEGIALAKGEFVTFLDHDDTFHPQKLELMVAEITKQKVDFLCSNCELVNAQTGKVDGLALGAITGDVTAGFAKRLLQGNFVPPNSTLIRRSVFEVVGMFDASFKGVDDYDLWYRISRVFPAGIIDKPLATWQYRNSNSISADDKKMIADERDFYQKIITSKRAFPGQDPRGAWQEWEREEAKKGVRRQTVHLANRFLLEGNYKEAAKLYDEADAARYASLTRKAGPVFRTAYLFKRRMGAAREFQSLNLDFSA